MKQLYANDGKLEDYSEGGRNEKHPIRKFGEMEFEFSQRKW